MIVVGATTPHRLDPARVLALGDRLGWPVLADPLSGCRVTGTIGAADAIVRTGPPVPECVVLLGTPWLSRALGDYVSDAASAGARVIVVDPYREWADPLRVATEFHHGPIGRVARGGRRRAGASDASRHGSTAGVTARPARSGAIAAVLEDGLSEPLVARTLFHHAAQESATARHLGIHAHPRPRVVRRARGGATEGGGEPRCQRDRRRRLDLPGRRRRLVVAGRAAASIALLGDLTFLHDVSGLVNLPAVPCTLVVVDNGGGGIFSFLPQARALDATTFETLFGTPPTSDVVAVARGFGLDAHEAATPSDLEAALAATAPARHRGPALIRVSVPGRPQNVAVHDAINEAVRRALA